MIISVVLKIRKKFIGIILVTTLLAIVFAGCTGDDDNKTYNVNQYSIYIETGLYASQSLENTYIILPILLNNNQTQIEIDYILFNNKMFVDDSYCEMESYKIEVTTYGFGINITPIPSKYLEIWFTTSHLSTFTKDDYEIKDQFYDNGPGLSMWSYTDKKASTYVYTSEPLTNEFLFEFRRYTTDLWNIVRDFGYSESLDEGWNELELERTSIPFDDTGD